METYTLYPFSSSHLANCLVCPARLVSHGLVTMNTSWTFMWRWTFAIIYQSTPALCTLLIPPRAAVHTVLPPHLPQSKDHIMQLASGHTFQVSSMNVLMFVLDRTCLVFILNIVPVA